MSVNVSLSELEGVDNGFIAIMAFVTYTVGLLSFNFLYLSFHVSDIELIKSNYIFAGTYYFVFLFSLTHAPYKLAQGMPSRIGVYIIICSAIYLLEEGHQNYFWYLVSKLFSLDTTIYHFETDSRLQVGMVLDFIGIVVVMIPLIITLEAGFKHSKEETQTIPASLLILPAFIGIFIYSYYVLPMIPQTLGGGKPPIVRVEFKKDTPYEISSNFDVSIYTKGGYSHYAKLIHNNSGKYFLAPVPWYNTSLFLIDEEYISLIEYVTGNPVEKGLQ